jgi:hypothetical protein
LLGVFFVLALNSITSLVSFEWWDEMVVRLVAGPRAEERFGYR